MSDAADKIGHGMLSARLTMVPAARTPIAHVRVASYNVHRCVGTDKRRDVQRVARVIRATEADIVGLQEIDCGYHYAQELDQLEELQHAIAMQGFSGPTMTRDVSTYGNALFTRHRVVAVRHIDLSIKRREPRAALDVDLEVGGALMRVVVTHFGLSPFERRSQTARLMHALREHEQPLTILCGDFNEWAPLQPTVRHLDRHFGRARALRTFPARRPVLPLDRIWIRPAASVTSVWVHRDALARVASDHLPICASVSF